MIELNKKKVRELFWSLESSDFRDVKSFCVKKEKHNEYYGDFDYSIIAVYKNGKSIMFAPYELTKEAVKEMRK